jgi:nicotinate-nucleotide adenylyltransferase
MPSTPRAIGRRVPLPPGGGGQRIGLFGGSFDPPHAGHAHVVRTALARLKLDRVWVLVTPGNPLKRRGPSLSTTERIAALRALLPEPRVTITDIETRAGLVWTRDTVAWFARHAPDHRFVWLMGADNLASFHRWGGWRSIAANVPIAIVDRPGGVFAASSARAAIALQRRRVPESRAGLLATTPAPAWTFLHARRVALSSTDLRGG